MSLRLHGDTLARGGMLGLGGDAIRVAVRTAEENAQLLAAVGELLA